MIRKGIAGFFFGCLVGFVFGTGGEVDLTVSLGIEAPQGRIVLMLFDSAEGFEDFRSPISVEAFNLPGDGMPVLRGLTPGAYALMVFHDENENRRLDLNFIGIPKEPIGFSNRYRPKGPPNYERAVFHLEPGEDVRIDVTLARPLGDRGRLGVGMGALARGNPYAGSGGSSVRVIPAVIYMGNRFQIYGPYAQLGLAGSGRTRLALTLAYRMRVYDTDDHSSLVGMENRKETAMGGIRLQRDALWGIDIHTGYTHDFLDRIGGGEFQVQASRPFPMRSVRFTPSIAWNWLSNDLARHDFGVSPSEIFPDRPAYRPGTVSSIEAGLGVFAEITPSLFGMINASVEWFDRGIRNSPIVNEDHVWKGMAFITYML